MTTIMKQVGYEPEKGAIFVISEMSDTRRSCRRFDPDTESKRQYPIALRGPSYSDAAGNYFAGDGTEYLYKYDGKRFRRIS